MVIGIFKCKHDNWPHDHEDDVDQARVNSSQRGMGPFQGGSGLLLGLGLVEQGRGGAHRIAQMGAGKIAQIGAALQESLLLLVKALQFQPGIAGENRFPLSHRVLVAVASVKIAALVGMGHRARQQQGKGQNILEHHHSSHRSAPILDIAALMQARPLGPIPFDKLNDGFHSLLIILKQSILIAQATPGSLSASPSIGVATETHCGRSPKGKPRFSASPIKNH
ncbi:hypothetical protein [Chromobacterium paludis]|uniref:Uncharacterized protein n=1 Tax=Chromobacterium paludis TaxID=2605945 RepID=A0A5C1DGL9_9NEIS|nr:hypothetical protein [Chromobacterium paludis]QEL55107.1 hypothetical protein FYK34_05770 [Chromobacterium paludis]